MHHNKMPRKPYPLIGILVLLLTAAALPARAWYGSRLLRLGDRVTVSLPMLARHLSSAEVIYFGEIHSRPEHHELELRLARTLRDTGRPMAIGVEMIETGNQARLDAWIAGRMNESEFKDIFNADWRGTWPLYRPLFRFARRHRIPMLALNVPDGITRKVARSGFYSLTPEEMARLPGVSCEVSPRYADMIRKALEMHGERAVQYSFEYFCQAQMVWDSTMAWRLDRYRLANPERAILVVAGNNHAWKPGIPARLRDRAPGLRQLVILPEIPGAQEPVHIDGNLADYLWLKSRQGV